MGPSIGRHKLRSNLLILPAAFALVSGVLSVLCAIPSLWAQGASNKPSDNPAPQIGPTLKVEVRAVLLDVAVTNKKGEPAAGLQEKDFEVLEDGVPQTVSFFEEHTEKAATRTVSDHLPPNFYTSSQTIRSSDSVNVLLLDWLNTQPPDQAYVRAQVIKYLRTVPQGTRLAIFELGTDLRIVQGFTSESSSLLSALNDKNSGANPKSTSLLASATRKASEQELVDLMAKSDAAPVAISAVKDSMSANDSRQTVDRVKLTMQGLLELERYLSAIPGRKNVFWFSGSFPISVFPGAEPGANFGAELRQSAEQFGPGRIAIYPIAAEGVTAASAYDPTQGLEGRMRVRSPDPSQGNGGGEKQIAMETLARETGGEAFYNPNNLDRDLEHALNDASHYYTLTYSPANPRPDGKFRNIQVKLAGGGYKLSYRRGYFAEAPRSAESVTQEEEDDRLLGLLRFGMPDFDQIAYKVRVAAEQPQPAPGAPRAGVNADLKGPLTRYKVDYLIQVKSLKLDSTADGIRHGFVELMLVAYGENGTPLNLVMSKEEVKLPGKLYESPQNVQIHARQEIDVPPGDVFLRVGLYEQSTGRVGTIGVPLRSPSGAPDLQDQTRPR